MLITPHLEAIGQLVADNIVSVIAAPTGAGKSLAIPKFFAEGENRVFVSLPTVTAVHSLTTYQRKIFQSSQSTSDVTAASIEAEMSDDPQYSSIDSESTGAQAAAPSKGPRSRAQRRSPKRDLTIGSAAESVVDYDDSSKIIYATSGHLRRKMLSYFKDGKATDLDFTDVLIIDEVHSGSMDNSVNIDLWVLAAKQQPPVQVPFLILTSATVSLDSEILRSVETYYKPAIYNVPMPGYPVGIHYLPKPIEQDQLPDRILKTVIEVHNSSIEGGILIFMPGSGDVEKLVVNLESARLENAVILPAYGAMKSSELQLIHQPVKAGYRKIVIATNVAESSITIEDLGVVIDSMLEKRAETSASGGLRLVTTQVSQSSADQRKGRTGRTRPGVCYRMTTKELYDQYEKQKPSDITQVPLYSIIMELLNSQLNPGVVLSEVSPERITSSMHLLRRLGLIETTNGLTTPTEAGKFVDGFPLSIRNATALQRWHAEGKPMFPAIMTLALIDCYEPPYFYYPRRGEGQTMPEYEEATANHQAQYFKRFRGRSDVDTLVNVGIDLMDQVGDYNHAGRVLQWANENSMNHKKIREFISIVKQCINQCHRRDIECRVGKFTREGVMKHLRPILADVYSDMTMQTMKSGAQVSFRLNTPGGPVGYRLDQRKSLNEFNTDPPPYIVALLTAELVSRKHPIRFLTLGLDVEPVNVPADPQPIVRRAIPARRTQDTLTGAQAQEAQAKLAAATAALAKLRKK